MLKKPTSKLLHYKFNVTERDGNKNITTSPNKIICKICLYGVFLLFFFTSSVQIIHKIIIQKFPTQTIFKQTKLPRVPWNKSTTVQRSKIKFMSQTLLKIHSALVQCIKPDSSSVVVRQLQGNVNAIHHHYEVPQCHNWQTCCKACREVHDDKMQGGYNWKQSLIFESNGHGATGDWWGKDEYGPSSFAL